MLRGKLSIAALSILVAVATAHPYAEWNHARYRWNDLFAARDEGVGALVKSQATVESSSCTTVTEMKNEKSYRVRVCAADPEDSIKVCLGTRVHPCCPGEFSKGNLISSNKVNVAGNDVTVTYYHAQDANANAAGVCFRLDDAHQRAETCSQSRAEGTSCLSPCLAITTTCFDNTLTGDSSSCDGNVCQCKTGYLPPDCCQCDTTNFYLPDCKPFCRDNCRIFRPNNLGGCQTCSAGFTGAPECCQCEPGKTEVNGVCKCDINLKPDGTCAEGALEPDCCECDATGNATHAFYKTPSGECKPYCDNNCAGSIGLGCSECKTGFMSPPECCQCEPGREEVNGVCKCRANLKPDGTCAEGALEPDCCECDTTGNATHAFYKTPSGECKPYCDNNCAGSIGLGCSECRPGFLSPPECCQCEPGREEVNGVCKCSANLRPDGSCIPEAKPEDCCECITGYQRGPSGKCEPERCDKQQKIFFYIDVTASNIFENFCPLMVVMQMLVAAFNPSSTSGTKVASVLFSDNGKDKPPSHIFEMDTPCFDAVQGSGRSLSSLMIDFGRCLDNDRNYDSTLFPPSCGEGTSAVKGLQEIYRLASNGKSSVESAILMLTDGVIQDDDSERSKVLSDLTSAGIRTIIAAGINEADEENLRLYTSNDNILVSKNAVQLGIDIVNKMQERGIVCKDHAGNITMSLRKAQESSLDLFCRCHRQQYIGRDICKREYPKCGGDLSISLPNLKPAKMQDVEASSEYVNQMSIEKEILAAVEKVLEEHHG